MPGEGTASAHCMDQSLLGKISGGTRFERGALCEASREGCSSFQLRMDISY